MCSVAIKLGSIIGFIMPSFYVSEDKDYAETREDLWNYTLAQSVVVSIFSIPIFFIIKDKPITPASASAEKQMYSTSGNAQLQDISPEEEIRRSFSKSFDLIISNLNYWVLNISQSFTRAMFLTTSSIISIMLTPFGYHPNMIGYMISSYSLAG